MDITPLFKACIKTVKTRNRTFGIQSPISVPSEDRQRILKVKSKNSFLITAKEIVSQITKLRDFLFEHRDGYLSFINSSVFDPMSEDDRLQIDLGAQRIINTCSHLVKEFRNDNRKLTANPQTREFMDAVIDLIDAYLKAVCKIHSEFKAFRVKKALDVIKLSKLETDKPQGDLEVDEKESNALNEEVQTWMYDRGCADEEELCEEELQLFESENVEMYYELNSMSDEVRQIETKVLHIAELQEIFTEKILQQDQDIGRIANTVVGTTENVKDANVQIKQAIQRNAGLRVYVLFFLLVMSFTLLFLDWYND